jgi:hypothetical protein
MTFPPYKNARVWTLRADSDRQPQGPFDFRPVFHHAGRDQLEATGTYLPAHASVVNILERALPAGRFAFLDNLPEDIKASKAVLRLRDGERPQLRETVSTLEHALSARPLEIEQLKLRRMQFGRKSEKLGHQLDQLETCLEDLLAEKGESQGSKAISAAPIASHKAVRQPL